MLHRNNAISLFLKVLALPNSLQRSLVTHLQKAGINFHT